MNGPQHYAKAEELLAYAATDVSDNWPVTSGERKADILAAAQVHATLAHVAALIDSSLDDICNEAEWGVKTAAQTGEL